MKKMKKILAFVLAMAMVLGMSVTAFAELGENQQSATGTNADKGTITVEGIDPEFSTEEPTKSNVVVTAYQIIKAKYENNGTSFVGYESLYPNSLEISAENGTVSVREEDLNAIIAEMEFVDGVPTSLTEGAATKALTYNATDKKYSADQLPVGSYLVVVSGADAKIYSPIVVSIFYAAPTEDGNVTENGSVNIVNGTAWIKVSGTPNVDKTATPDSDLTIEGSDNKSVNVGDEINYQVLINPVPYYGGEHPVFKLTDTLSEGLSLKDGAAGVKVKLATVNGTVVTPGAELSSDDYNYSITVSGQTIVVDFVDDEDGYVLNELQGKALVVEYTAVVTEDANFNGESNDNNATLDFSRDSNIEGSDEEKTVKTYNYTFDLSASVSGSETDSMVTKVGVEIGNTTTSGLPGAEFTLYTDATCGTKYTNDIMTDGVVTSGDTGAMVIRGLSVGTYYMKETKAPNGYSLNDHVYKIEITAQYYDNFTQDDVSGVPVTHKGKLKSYEIKVDGSTIITGNGNEVDKLGAITVDKGTVYKQTTADGEENEQYGGTDTFEIKNTKLSTLPSTGGIGTTIFTIGGCAIMILAAGLFFATRRKAEK